MKDSWGASRQGRLFKVWVPQADVKSLGLSPLEEAGGADLLSGVTDEFSVDIWTQQTSARNTCRRTVPPLVLSPGKRELVSVHVRPAGWPSSPPPFPPPGANLTPSKWGHLSNPAVVIEGDVLPFLKKIGFHAPGVVTRGRRDDGLLRAPSWLRPS